jgi:DNA-binding IclR family transcriptional regulator
MAGDDIVKSAARVFAVLELFEAEQRPMTATAIERALQWPQSSTLALLKTMVQLGYLALDPLERRYEPTLRLSNLGRWVGARFVQGHLDDLIREVAEATGETVSIVGQNDLWMEFLSVRAGRNPLTLNIDPGSRAPLFNSTIGMVALSCRTDREIAELGKRVRKLPAGERETPDMAHVAEEIAGIRKRGHAIGYGRYIASIGAIAWPLRQDGDPRPLVLSVAGPAEMIHQAEAAIVAAVENILTDHCPARSRIP